MIGGKNILYIPVRPVGAVMKSMMNRHDCDKIFGDDSMIKDYDEEYCGTIKERMLVSKLNTGKLFNNLKGKKSYFFLIHTLKFKIIKKNLWRFLQKNCLLF